jgi:stress response protein YsnF
MNPKNQQLNEPAQPRKEVETVHKIPVIEERVEFKKERVKTGTVRLKKEVETEVVPIELELNQSTISVQKIPKDELLDHPPQSVREEGDKVIYSVIREEPVTIIKYRLVEEIVVQKHTETENFTEEVELRKEKIQVDHSEQ